MFYGRTKYCQTRGVYITPPGLPQGPGGVVLAAGAGAGPAAAAAVWLHRPPAARREFARIMQTFAFPYTSFFLAFPLHCIQLNGVD